MPPINQILSSARKVLVLGALGAALSACTYVGQQADGTTNIVGLAAVQVTPHPGSPPPKVSVQSLGLTISDRAPDSGVVLGYSDRTFSAQGTGHHYPHTDNQHYRHTRNGEIDFIAHGEAEEYRPRYYKKKRKWRRSCRCYR